MSRPERDTLTLGMTNGTDYVPGLKTIEDALRIRSRILRVFEEAERDAYLTGRQIPIHFAVIGGGPTGVELAGAIADIAIGR